MYPAPRRAMSIKKDLTAARTAVTFMMLFIITIMFVHQPENNSYAMYRQAEIEYANDTILRPLPEDFDPSSKFAEVTTPTVALTNVAPMKKAPIPKPKAPTAPEAYVSSGPCPGPGKWTGTHAEWDRIAVQTLKNAGCTQEQVNMMMYIHHHEGGPNQVSKSGTFHGGWQLKASIAHSIEWWDPVKSTQRALAYVKGHKYQGYGSGIEAAYQHKLAHDWY
jgi:hypothetical protein